MHAKYSTNYFAQRHSGKIGNGYNVGEFIQIHGHTGMMV